MKFANTSGASNTNAASNRATGEASGDKDGGGGGSGPSVAVGGAGGSRPEGQSVSGQKEMGGNSTGQNGHQALLPGLRFHRHIILRRTLYGLVYVHIRFLSQFCLQIAIKHHKLTLYSSH